MPEKPVKQHNKKYNIHENNRKGREPKSTEINPGSITGIERGQQYIRKNGKIKHFQD